jgi:hypothetical protein
MKRALILLACILALASMVFAVLPLGTLALIPIVPALVLGFIAYRKSAGVQMHMARLAMLVAGVMLLIVAGKELFLKDTVDKDKQFEQKKIESEKEAKNELESEGL